MKAKKNSNFKHLYWIHCCCLVSKSRLTPVTPWTVAHQDPLSVGFSRQEHGSGLPFPSPGDLPDPGIEPGSPVLASSFFTAEPLGKLCWLCCCCSVTLSSLTLCNPMDCNTPGFPVLHHLLELDPIHVHWVDDAIKPSHFLPPPPLLLPSIFPSIRVFYNESALCIRWPSIGASASASVLPMNIQDWFPFGLIGLISLPSKGLSRVFSNTTVQKNLFFHAQPSLWSNSHIHTWLQEKPQLWLYRSLLAK